MSITTKSNHIGRKILKIRMLKGMSQETLAEAMGMSQQAISKLEQSKTLEDDKLEAVAKALGVTKEGIENFYEEKAINYFNNFYDSSFSNSQGTFSPESCTFNPLDKVVELYERLLQSEKDEIEYLEKLLNK